MASQLCGNCRKPNAHSHCGKCSSIFYCSRDCQVAHWKIHKKLCGKQAPIPVKGQFSMTKSFRGTSITFGYETRNISLQDKEEFEAAVAAVEAAGIEPPPVDDGGVTSIKLAITSINVPFIATLWMQETQYSEDTPIEIRRVQELATRITGAPNLFHLIMQRAGDKIAPSLSCKSANVSDQDTAITFLNSKYFPSGTGRWAALSCSHFLHLLRHCCDVDTELLSRTLHVQERLARETVWDTKEQDIALLQARLDQSDVKVAGQDLFELLSEVTRRSTYDNRISVPLNDVQSTITAAIASGQLGEFLSTQLTLPQVTVTADAVHPIVQRALETAASTLIASIHFPEVQSGVSLADSDETTTGTSTSVPYFTLRDSAKTVPFSTLVTWNAEESTSSAVVELVDGEPNSTIVVSNDGTGSLTGQLRVPEEVKQRLRCTAYLNAHLLMIRVMNVDASTEGQEEVLAAIRESAALYIIAKHFKFPEAFI